MGQFPFLGNGGAAGEGMQQRSSSSPSSNNVSPSQYLNFSQSPQSPDQNAAAGIAAQMLAAASGCATAGSQCRSFYCENEKCRRQVDKHPRGIVCTACMPSDKWHQCSTVGCTAVVHAVCSGVPLDSAWQCQSCSTKASECLPVEGFEPVVPASAVAEDCNEFHIFDSDADMYTFYRNQGFRVNNTQHSGRTWECRYCHATFYAKRMKDDRWSCPLTVEHEEKCARPVKKDVKDEHDESSQGMPSIRYFHEFGRYPGVLELIEILGCTGEIRTDSMQRTVRQQFKVHVNSGLLYRTAKNAHDEMFGSNISDIEELLKMSEEVGNEGGFLKLFTGDISVYTVCQS